MTTPVEALPGWLARLRARSRRGRVVLLYALVLLGIAAAIFAPPLAQPQWYHDFADRRALFGVANFGDVVSNLAFLAAGVAGLVWLAGRRGRALFPERLEIWPWAVFFAGAVLVTTGSAYYHLAPDDARLVWDRAPIAIAFGALFAGFTADRVDRPTGVIVILPVMVVLGGASLWIWSVTGDLRFHALVRVVPLLLVVAMCLLFPGRVTDFRHVLAAFVAFAAATVLELTDKTVFAATGGAISGHTLKHLVAAVAVFLVLRMLVVASRRSEY